MPSASSSGPIAKGASSSPPSRVGPRHVEKVAAVDVEDIESDWHLGDALCLGDELLGEQGGRHHVEDVDRVQRQGALST